MAVLVFEVISVILENSEQKDKLYINLKDFEIAFHSLIYNIKSILCTAILLGLITLINLYKEFGGKRNNYKI